MNFETYFRLLHENKFGLFIDELKKDQNLNTLQSSNMQILQKAAELGKIGESLAIIGKGIPVDIANRSYNKTPFHIAVEKQHYVLASMLHWCGADRDAALRTVDNEPTRSAIESWKYDTLILAALGYYAIIDAEINSAYSQRIISRIAATANNLLADEKAESKIKESPYSLSSVLASLAELASRRDQPTLALTLIGARYKQLQTDIHHTLLGVWALKYNQERLHPLLFEDKAYLNQTCRHLLNSDVRTFNMFDHLITDATKESLFLNANTATSSTPLYMLSLGLADTALPRSTTVACLSQLRQDNPNRLRLVEINTLLQACIEHELSFANTTGTILDLYLPYLFHDELDAITEAALDQSHYLQMTNAFTALSPKLSILNRLVAQFLYFKNQTSVEIKRQAKTYAKHFKPTADEIRNAYLLCFYKSMQIAGQQTISVEQEIYLSHLCKQFNVQIDFTRQIPHMNRHTLVSQPQPILAMILEYLTAEEFARLQGTTTHFYHHNQNAAEELIAVTLSEIKEESENYRFQPLPPTPEELCTPLLLFFSLMANIVFIYNLITLVSTLFSLPEEENAYSTPLTFTNTTSYSCSDITLLSSHCGLSSAALHHYPNQTVIDSCQSLCSSISEKTEISRLWGMKIFAEIVVTGLPNFFAYSGVKSIKNNVITQLNSSPETISYLSLSQHCRNRVNEILTPHSLRIRVNTNPAPTVATAIALINQAKEKIFARKNRHSLFAETHIEVIDEQEEKEKNSNKDIILNISSPSNTEEKEEKNVDKNRDLDVSSLSSDESDVEMQPLLHRK